MLIIFHLLIRRFFSEMYTSKLVFLASFIGSAMGLVVYWYTAKAFGKAFDNQDYFSYVVIGEALLALPLAVCTGVGRVVHMSLLDGTLEHFILSSKRIEVPVILSTLALGLSEALRVLVNITLAVTVFSLSVKDFPIFQILLLQIVSLPLWLGIGFLGSGVVLFFGRGIGVINHLGSLAVIFAGTYFPLSILPMMVQKFGSLSPFAVLLNSSRALLNSESVSLIHLILFFIIVGIALLGFGILIFKNCLRLGFRRGYFWGASIS